jgi:ATP-binding cassette subfamily B multidrug efflux pump
MQSLRRIIRYLKPYRRDAILATITLIGSVILDLLIPRLVQQVIDLGVVPRNVRMVVWTSVLMLGASLLSAACSVGNTIWAVRATQNMSADLRSDLFRKVQSLSFSNLDRLQTGQLLVRLTSDVRQVQTITLMSLRMIIRAPLMLLGSLFFLIITSWQLALIMVVLLPAMTGLVTWVVTHTHPIFREVQRRLDRLNTVMQENLAGVRVVKAFVRDEFEEQRFDATNTDLMSISMRVHRLFSRLMPTLMVMVNLGVAVVLWFSGVRVAEGTFTVGATMAFVNYLMSTMFPLMVSGMIAGQLSAAEASAGRILEVLDDRPDVQDPPQPREIGTLTGRVVFENVTFGYDGKEAEPVLKGINLVAEPGETVAILGATGAGKSSLVHLIPRFYDVDDGCVTIDGIDVREMRLDDLRRHVAVAMQETVLFSGTIRDNIRYGRPDATDEEVEAAARAAQAHDFITSFPQGYDTVVGQRGVTLSGGQRQRVAIARALLVRPPVLILDDSTSAVDVETEARIQDALESTHHKGTRFIIAQRISSVLTADKFVVLDRGQVAAVGTHAELMTTSPIYQEIYASQLGDGNGNGRGNHG